jgi:hypothetical protein
MRRAGRSLVVLVASVLLLSGCASSVRTQLNTFMAPEAQFGQGTVAVRPANPDQQDSLEFDLYRSKLERRLVEQGYEVATPEEARYIARLGYRVEEIRYDTRQPNVVFTTGFGSYYRRGGVGLLLNEGPRYEEEYLRRVTLTITRTPEELGGEARRIYETTALSKGTCPIMSVVFDEMLAAIFQDFPGQNGQVKTVTVRGEANCR